MRITVKVEGRTFEVEIESLDSNPIIAKVDNRIYEVTLEDLPNSVLNEGWIKPTYPLQEGSGNGNGKLIHGNGRRKKTIASNVISSPIPGVVVSIDIAANQEVQAGQIVCVIEAMKMKNFIRAPKSGVIRSIAVFTGKAVQANEPIAYYSD